MSLTGVKMAEEVWLTCVTHAFSTETEEIMGLLLGDIEVPLFLYLTCENLPDLIMASGICDEAMNIDWDMPSSFHAIDLSY